MVKATWNGILLAQSDKTKVVDGTHYFPPDSVRHEFLRLSPTATTREGRGVLLYYTIQDGVRENPNAAWSFPDPVPEAEWLGIRDHVAFWKGVEVE